jgi:hypothetical protein
MIIRVIALFCLQKVSEVNGGGHRCTVRSGWYSTGKARKSAALKDREYLRGSKQSTVEDSSIRVLRPLGVFSWNWKAGTVEGLDDEPGSFGGDPRYYACYRRREMKALLCRTGFRAIALESCPGKVFGEKIVLFWA